MVTYKIEVSDEVDGLLARKVGNVADYIEKHVRKLAVEKKSEELATIPAAEIQITKTTATI